MIYPDIPKRPRHQEPITRILIVLALCALYIATFIYMAHVVWREAVK